MTALFIAGGETKHSHAEGLAQAGTTWTYDTTTKRTGTASWKVSSSAGPTQDFTYTSPSNTVIYYSAIYLYIPTSPGYPVNNARIISVCDTSFTPFASLLLTTAGKIQVVTGVSTQVGSDSAVLAKDTWHLLELGVKRGSTGLGDGYIEGKVNGTSIGSSNSRSFTNGPVHFEFGWIDAAGGTRDLYYDDLYIGDDQGSNNNTWRGDHKVVMLFPVSDNAIGTWTGGAGGTTNLWDAVNNVVPVGVASTGTDTSQIGNPTSSTTDNYDANMTDYTTAGILSGDTVTAIVGVAEGANSSTTGTDTLRVKGVSNPAITETSPTIDIVAGTYPTGWNRCATAILEAPSVTKGTQPVMRVGKNIAATRRANVCLMGLYVDYTVGAVVVPKSSLPIWF